MPKYVEFNGETIEFPDSMGDAQIADVLKKQSSQQSTSAAEVHQSPYSDDALFQAAKNTPGSAMRFFSGVMDAVSSPVQTAKAIGGLGVGLAQKLIPGQQDQEKYVDAAVDFYKDRYASPEKALTTFVEDPVGVAADIGGVFGGVAGAAKLAKLATASKLPMVANAAGKASLAADAVATAVDPVRMPIVAAGKVLKGGVRALGGPTSAETLYESALKPPKGRKWPVEKQERAVTTGLKEEVVLRRGGTDSLDVIRDKIDLIDDEIKTRIQSGAAAGETIDPVAVADRIDQIAPQFETVNPGAGRSALTAVKSEFMNENSVDVPTQVTMGRNPFTGLPVTKTVTRRQPVPIPVDEAQSMKQKTYTELRKTYGELGSAKTEGQKALARGIKEELAAKFPELSALNARDSALIELEEAVERFVGRTNSRDVLPFKGAMVSPRGWIDAAIATFVDNPDAKSRLAIAIYKARNPGSSLGRVRAVGSKLPMLATSTERVKTSTAAAQQ